MRQSASKVPYAELKTALVGALQLAEKAVNGLPIPGVQGCISGILIIIEKEELRKANVETFRGLVDIIHQFKTVTIERLSKAGHLSEDVQRDVQDLAKRLVDIPAKYTAGIGESKMKRLKNLMSASDNAQALNNLGNDLKSAIELFQTALLVNIEVADQKRDVDRLVDKLPVEPKAAFNAHRQHEIELCEQGTRVDLLADVTRWANGIGPNKNKRVLWLNGKAGVGKSTIAKTLATRFHNKQILGSSFMFSKPNGVTDGSVVFTTVAHQLARHIPEFRNHLAAAIQAKGDSIHAEIHIQFEDLLATPLSQLQSPPETVIILDALDECTPKLLPPMLTLLLGNMSRFPFLRLVITSRPETQIRDVLLRFRESIHEVDLNKIPASEDISTYLQRRLTIAYSCLVGDSDGSGAWPVGKDLASLVRLADNLFIFAATAVRFIGDDMAGEPQRRLEILCGQHISQEYPLSTLDIMYQDILRSALPEGRMDLHARFQDVVGAIVLAIDETPSVESLTQLLHPMYSASSIRHSLRSLHSVLVVPEEDNKAGLQVYHKSFAEFITDPNRCTQMEAFLQPFSHRGRLSNYYLNTIVTCISRYELSHQPTPPTFDIWTSLIAAGMSPLQFLYHLSFQLFAVTQLFNNLDKVATTTHKRISGELDNTLGVPTLMAGHGDATLFETYIAPRRGRWNTVWLKVTSHPPHVISKYKVKFDTKNGRWKYTAWIHIVDYEMTAQLNWVTQTLYHPVSTLTLQSLNLDYTYTAGTLTAMFDTNLV